MSDTTAPPSAAATPEPQAEGMLAVWWRVMDFKIGIVPAPVFVLILGLAAFFVAQGKVPSDILMNMAVLAAGGFACAELGKRLPVIRNVGAAAIFATFIPSYLAFAHALPTPLVTSITTFTK